MAIKSNDRCYINCTGVDPSLLSPTASVDKLHPTGIANVGNVITHNSSQNGNLSYKLSASREDDDVFSEAAVFGDICKAPRRRRMQTGINSGLPAQRNEDVSALQLTTSVSFGGMNAVKVSAHELEYSGSLSARGAGMFSSNDSETTNQQSPLKLSPRSPHKMLITTSQPGSVYNPAESLFPSFKAASASIEFGAAGSDVPSIRLRDGARDRDRSRSKSPGSPRRHIGEFENKKSNKLSFV